MPGVQYTCETELGLFVNIRSKLAAQAHELGLPCVICELLFVKFTLCIYPFHVCKYNVMYLLYKNTHTISKVYKNILNGIFKKKRQKKRSKMLFEAGRLVSLLCWLRPYSFIKLNCIDVSRH